MQKTVDFSKSVFELSREDPEFIEIMKELGFEQIANPTMLNTVGRVMTIPKGALMKGMELGKIKETFIQHGYTVKE